MVLSVEVVADRLGVSAQPPIKTTIYELLELRYYQPMVPTVFGFLAYLTIPPCSVRNRIAKVWIPSMSEVMYLNLPCKSV